MKNNKGENERRAGERKEDPLAGKLTKEQGRELLIRVLERCLEDKRAAEAEATSCLVDNMTYRNSEEPD